MPKTEPVESEMSQSPAADEPGFGWTTYAERINGRFAMVGFLALLLLEFFTRQDFFTWLGLPLRWDGHRLLSPTFYRVFPIERSFGSVLAPFDHKH